MPFPLLSHLVKSPSCSRERGGWRVAGVLLGVVLLALVPVRAQEMQEAQDVQNGQGSGTPRFEAVRAAYRSSETWLLDRRGAPLQRIRTDFQVRRGQWLALEEVSPALLHAVVLGEDRNFYAHSGVDWSAVSAAAWANLWNERTRGASTITMQLAGLLHAPLQPGAGRRTWGQKIGQVRMAYALERGWSKAQILEAYLNLAPFRGELVGLDALAQSLFAKKAHALDMRESAIAVALLRAPNASVAKVAERACAALKLAESPWGQDCHALHFYTTAALRRRHFAALDGVAPHFARYALAQYRHERAREGLPQNLPSSLHAGLQRFASETLRRHLQEIAAQNVQDGAVLVLDNATGEVLAWVGSSGQRLSRASEVDAVLALRQPGSTLKPFLYAQAIAQGRLTAASLLDDSPARIPTAHGLYVPQNYDLGFKGWVSVRLALASSLNIPAVRALVMVSPDDFAQQLRQWGLPLPEPAGYYGYSLALGGVDVSLLHLTNAYRTLANGGLHGAVRWQVQPQDAPSAVSESVRVLDEGTSFIIGDILADRHARATTFGTDSQLATRFWSAVKTGTSKDMRDNWAIGYTGHFTIGVWVGNADGSPMQDVSGISGAAPVWAAVAGYLHALRPGVAPRPPAGLVHQRIEYVAPDGQRLEAGRMEWFLPGTEQSHFSLRLPTAPVDAPAAVRILQPQDGTILAIDPDIPPANQLLRFASSQPGVVWRINGEKVHHAREDAQWFWPLQPGPFQIELRDASDQQVLDRIRIQVRGLRQGRSGG